MPQGPAAPNLSERCARLTITSPEPNPKFTYDGDTYVQAVEFTPKGAVAKALIGYGNASRPSSPHITDQLPYYEQKQLRAVYRTRSEVEAHAVTRECY
jgi:acyl-homoserine-lactone acylase